MALAAVRSKAVVLLFLLIYCLFCGGSVVFVDLLFILLSLFVKVLCFVLVLLCSTYSY